MSYSISDAYEFNVQTVKVTKPDFAIPLPYHWTRPLTKGSASLSMIYR